MARSSSGFTLPIGFMSGKDRAKIANEVASIDTDWCDVNYIYQPNSESSWYRDNLYMEESGVDVFSIEKMMMAYITFVLNNYPDVDICGHAYYNQLNAEGEYHWEFAIKDGIAKVHYIGAPLNLPWWCPECDEELEYDSSDIEAKNYKKFTLTCKRCGRKINLHKEYDVEVKDTEYTKADF